MIEDLAPYEEGKYYNCKNLYIARTIYNVAGLRYFYKHYHAIFEKPYLRRSFYGYLLSLALLDAAMFREYMKNRDRSDVMFQ